MNKRKGPKPEYPTGIIEGDSNGRKNISLPEELYTRLISMAEELGYSSTGVVSILPMLDAFTELDLVDVEEILKDSDLLQKRGVEWYDRFN